MTITAKVIAHSRTPGAPDIVTLQLRYPRFIHAEFMTHRVFSRNASSSRAIPIERMIQDVVDDPAMPVAWGSNKPGMQAGEELTGEFRKLAEHSWLRARDAAVGYARDFLAYGAHKQIVNRLLEPFAHISVVVTATEWDNFFALRCHPDADPTMRALAEAIRDAISGSTPWAAEPGWTWHLPYITEDDWRTDEVQFRRQQSATRLLSMVSAARCARVSYLNHDGSNPDIKKDLTLAERLLESRHMSPFEHQAMSIKDGNIRSANFVGWAQFRNILESEMAT